MTRSYRFRGWRLAAIALVSAFLISTLALAQSAGNSGSISGTVLDPTGAVVPNATVEIRNPVTALIGRRLRMRGKVRFPNIPFNNYHLTVKATGFVSAVQDVELRSAVPVTAAITLQVSGSLTTVTVEAEAEI